ncbi:MULTISPECIES: hypothetical protein [unclassified Bradyrhizobium]|uniref:hypothetical protein n=1 Tax=unclassified Bradyrhizobium TaxID=2631580 RepID=UPI001FF745A2|nr:MULTISPECIES: hypothetical protein [unclassified Bradyrhizobium]MCK1713946.1 hypothetical protein [Bradyrhizobium sp. 143]
MDIDLRNGLWQACNEFHFRPFNRHYPSDFRFKRNMDVVFVDFFKMPSDTVRTATATGSPQYEIGSSRPKGGLQSYSVPVSDFRQRFLCGVQRICEFLYPEINLRPDARPALAQACP